MTDVATTHAKRMSKLAASLLIVALIATACTSSNGTNVSTTTPQAWRLELPIPMTTNWRGDDRVLQNGAGCNAQSGRVHIKDGTGEIIGTGPIAESGTVTGLPDNSKSVGAGNARAAGGKCLAEATVIPLVRTAHIYVIVIEEDGNERESIFSSTEVEALGWLHSD